MEGLADSRSLGRENPAFPQVSMVPVLPVLVPWMVRAVIIIVVVIVMPSRVVDVHVDDRAMIGVATRAQRPKYPYQTEKNAQSPEFHKAPPHSNADPRTGPGLPDSI